MVVFAAFVGSSLQLVDADDADHARWHIAHQLGYEHKPWLLKDLNIRPADLEELATWKAQGAKVAKAKSRKDWQETP